MLEQIARLEAKLEAARKEIAAFKALVREYADDVPVWEHTEEEDAWINKLYTLAGIE